MNLRRGGGTPPYVYHVCGDVGRHALMPPCPFPPPQASRNPVVEDSQSAREANAAAHGPGTYTRRPCVTLYATKTQK